MNKGTPLKLRNDAIVEALCEVRFETPELSEIIIGKLSENWPSFTKRRLPTADIPLPIRTAEPNLKYTPTLELTSQDNVQAVRIGSNVCSLHIREYCGWRSFQPMTNSLVDLLFDKVPDLTVQRIGFRYTNAVRSDLHRMKSLSELNLKIQVAGVTVNEPVNLNFIVESDPTHFTMTRLASFGFIKGPVPERVIGIIDIDVYTPDIFSSTDRHEVTSWIEKAHQHEKAAFFKLIPDDVLEILVEEWSE